MKRHHACAVAVLLSLVLFQVNGVASPSGAPGPSPPASGSKQAEARLHFTRGVALVEDEAWDAALAEFTTSLELSPSRSATKDSAICLKKLHRYDEAMSMLESLLRDFPDLPAADRSVAENELRELAAFVGTIALAGAPDGATVTIDDRPRGATPLAPQRATTGTHVVRITKEGFVPFEAKLTVVGDQTAAVDVVLSPTTAPEAPVPTPNGVVTTAPVSNAEAPAPSSSLRAFAEAEVAFAATPGFGGALGASCSGACESGLGAGFLALAHGGVFTRSGFGFSVDAGYLSVGASLKNRNVALHPIDLPDNLGTAEDDLRLSGLLLGGSAVFDTMKRVPLILRLGVGVLLGTLHDERDGTASTNARANPNPASGGAEFPARAYPFDSSESPGADSFYLAPEVRTGFRASEHFELSIGLRALVLFAFEAPSWSDVNPVVPGPDYHVGQLTFGAQALSARTMIILTPGVSARFEF